MLICPNCRKELFQIGNRYQCKSNHSFDISKEGYINLLLPNQMHHLGSGDNREMVKARNLFLNNGHYSHLANFLCDQIKNIADKNSIIIDVGCGEGYFTNRIANTANLPKRNICGLDISKEAIRLAAKNNSFIPIVASGIAMPIETQSADIILNVFAPVFPFEFQRCLKQNGYLIKVVPGPNHLKELKNALYDSVIIHKEKIPEFDFLSIIKEDSLVYQIHLEQTDLWNLFKMTPFFYKTPEKDKLRLNCISSIIISLSFKILLYQNKKVNP